MGSSLILSKYATLNTYYRSVKDHPPPGWAAVPLTLGTYAHTQITWFMLHFKTQKPALWPPISASSQGKEWEDTQWEVWQLPQADRAHPSLCQGEAGGGETHAIWLCIAALFFLHDFVFPVITLDFRLLHLLQKPSFPQSLYMACRMRNSTGKKEKH